MKNNNVECIDKPRCSLCGKFKDINEINGYDPLAPIGQKFKQAYCIKIVECESPDARKQLDKISKHLN